MQRLLFLEDISETRLVFWGTAFLVAGLILSAASVALASKYTHERNSPTDKRGGICLSVLLVTIVLGLVALLIWGHCADSRRTCAHLEAVIAQHGLLTP
jgi:Kef-type K+ transport system membrane component KefB